MSDSSAGSGSPSSSPRRGAGGARAHGGDLARALPERPHAGRPRTAATGPLHQVFEASGDGVVLDATHAVVEDVLQGTAFVGHAALRFFQPVCQGPMAKTAGVLLFGPSACFFHWLTVALRDCAVASVKPLLMASRV